MPAAILGLQDGLRAKSREVGVMRMLLSMARCASTFLAAITAGITSCRSEATATLSLSLSQPSGV